VEHERWSLRVSLFYCPYSGSQWAQGSGEESKSYRFETGCE